MEARRATLVFGTNIVGALTGLVILFFVGRFMSPAAYGAFGFAMAFLGLWMVLADLGLQQSHTRAITRGADLGDCITTFGRLKLVVFIAFLLAMLASFWGYRQTDTLRDSSGRYVLLAVVLYATAFYLRTIPSGTFAALRMTATTQLTVLVEHGVRLPLTIFAALFFGYMTGERVPWPGAADWIAGHSPFTRPMAPDHGGLLLALALAVALWVSLAVSRVMFSRQSFPKGRFDAALARSYIAFAIPVALGASTRIVFANLDAVFIGWFLDADNVGYYFAADRLALLVLMVPVALQAVFLPVFGELAHKGDTALLVGVARNLQRAISLVMILAVVFVAVLPAQGIRLFIGTEFLPAQDPLRMLAFNALFLSLSLIPIMIIMLLGNPYTIVRIGVLALGLNVALNLLFIPDTLLGRPVFGLHSAGAALATAIAQFVALIMLLTHVRRLMGQSLLGWPTAKHVLAGLVTAGILRLAQAAILGGAERIWTLAAAAALGVIVYLVTLVALGELSRADATILQEAVNPGRMLDDVRAELRDKRMLR